jgi:hypothetical protein
MRVHSKFIFKRNQPKFYVIDTSVQPNSSILDSVNIPTAGRLAKTGNLIFIFCSNSQSFDRADTVDVTIQTSPSVLHTESHGWAP